MPTYYSKELVQEINDLLNIPPAKQSIITTWKTIMKRFKEEGIVKEKKTIHVCRILCHPRNRGGFMLNGFNAHANASKVKKVGANRAELHGACVIQLMPFPAEREKQMNANRKVAAASNGLISPPNGDEDLLSIGTGHMVSFCRAAQPV